VVDGTAPPNLCHRGRAARPWLVSSWLSIIPDHPSLYETTYGEAASSALAAVSVREQGRDWDYQGVVIRCPNGA
jgi:hypothetical protein